MGYVSPFRTSQLTTAQVITSARVRQLTWVEAALLYEWMLGRGAQLIPSNAPIVTIASTSEHIFAYRVRPRYQAVERRWYFRFRAASEMSVDVEVPSGGTAVTIPVSVERENVNVWEITETLGSQSDTETTLEWAVTPSASTNLVVEDVSCWEIPRDFLPTDADNGGLDTTHFASEQPVRATSHANMLTLLAGWSDAGRRCALSHWSVPYSVGGTTSTSFAKSFAASGNYAAVLADGVPVLLRKDRRADVTGTLTGKALAWVTGSTADLRLTSSVNGSGANITISNTTPAWSDPFTADVDCEDLESDDGRQTAATPAWDMVTVDARKNNSGTLYVAAYSLTEA